MKVAKRTSSLPKMSGIPTLETCDEEPSSVFDSGKALGEHTSVEPKTGGIIRDGKQFNNNTSSIPRRIMRNKTKSHGNYGSIEKVSKSFEDEALARFVFF